MDTFIAALILFFYVYLLQVEHKAFDRVDKIIVSGLIEANDSVNVGASRLTSLIRGDVIDRGYSEAEVNKGRLLSIKRV